MVGVFESGVLCNPVVPSTMQIRLPMPVPIQEVVSSYRGVPTAGSSHYGYVRSVNAYLAQEQRFEHLVRVKKGLLTLFHDKHEFPWVHKPNKERGVTLKRGTRSRKRRFDMLFDAAPIEFHPTTVRISKDRLPKELRFSRRKWSQVLSDARDAVVTEKRKTRQDRKQESEEKKVKKKKTPAKGGKKGKGGGADADASEIHTTRIRVPMGGAHARRGASFD
jgi:hypothetical protein